MTLPQSLLPAFGQADLSNCEREQIHLAASIQPHGALLVLDEADFAIMQASANAATFLGNDAVRPGAVLDAVAANLAHAIRPYLDEPLDAVAVAVRCHAGRDGEALDLLLHRVAGDGLVVELERAGPAVDLARHVETGLRTVLMTTSLPALCDEAARLFRDLTGYDRVMVYRFDDDGHGEVIAEQRREALESFLGNRYPASDIPQIARRLYVRNRVRVLVDIDYAPVPLVPRLLPRSGRDLDMSLCALRSVSPIHVQYLRNMGVRATLVVSLMVGGRLWGLVSCHHYQPRFVHFETRAVCDVLAEAVATRIAALESFAEGQAELAVRRLEQRMIDAISRKGDWCAALFDNSQPLLAPLGASGVALLYEGQICSAGEVPGTAELRRLGTWLDSRPRGTLFATASLGLDEPRFAALTAVASGMVATPVSQSPGEYLIWFRPEQVRTVTWGGNPFKPMQIGDDPADLSPRRSFAQWHQIVEGTCENWSAADLTAARLIGETVRDVVLQFRSVRLLIAQDQLRQVSGQVQHSEQPVIVADATGKILLANETFRRLLPDGREPPRELEALSVLFADPTEVRRRLWDLLRQRRTWRGEVQITDFAGEVRPMLVRADPVFSAPGHVLGFVLLFADLTQRKAAEAARRYFQERIVTGPRPMHATFDPAAGLAFQQLISPLVENAQLAALEITDRVDMARMPDLLESVRDSMTRAAEILEHLVSHASRTRDPQA